MPLTWTWLLLGLLLQPLRARGLRCVSGDGMLSQPEKFAPCFKKFGKDKGDQMSKGCISISDEVRI